MVVRVRHRDVAGQQVEQRRDVGGALDRGVPAQRQDAAARAADVAQQQLQDRRGADVLHADGVLGPADRVAERGRALASRVLGDRLAYLAEQLRRDAADLLDHLGRVAGEVPLQHLEHAARMLQRLVALRLARRASGRRSRAPRRAPDSDRSPSPVTRRTARRAARPRRARSMPVVLPGRRVVGAGLGVEAAEQPVEVLGVAEVLAAGSSPRWCRPRRSRGTTGRCSST